MPNIILIQTASSYPKVSILITKGKAKVKMLPSPIPANKTRLNPNLYAKNPDGIWFAVYPK